MTTTDRLLGQLRNRIRDAWDADPLYVDPLIRTGLTARQMSAIESAVRRTAETGLPVFVAIHPSVPIRYETEWDRFTADLAFAVYEDSGAKTALVLFAEAESAAKSAPYIVDANGPSMPADSSRIEASATGDYLPVELAVPFHLDALVAAATGAPHPPPLNFDPIDIDEEAEQDYIGKKGLDIGNPDGVVFTVTGLAALGLAAWVFTRRERNAWKTTLTTSPELVRSHRLRTAVTDALADLPEPVGTDDGLWDIRERGRRVQEAITAVVDAHPDWASAPDHAHRQAIHALTRTAAWARSALTGETGTASAAPRFCYFFPSHEGTIGTHTWKQRGTVLDIDVCATCRADLAAGRDPVCLMVPGSSRAKRPRAVPYFRRDDAYAVSGFGSFTDLEDAILEVGVPDAEAAETVGGRR